MHGGNLIVIQAEQFSPDIFSDPAYSGMFSGNGAEVGAKLTFYFAANQGRKKQSLFHGPNTDIK
jgi:hypothetical protein